MVQTYSGMSQNDNKKTSNTSGNGFLTNLPHKIRHFQGQSLAELVIGL